jgi:hypothetical protein
VTSLAVAWGTIPDWLAAVGTVGALGVALVLLAKELRARREAIEDRVREHARYVAAWLGEQPSSSPGLLAVHNGGQEPAYECIVKWTHSGYDEPPQLAAFAVLPPGETMHATVTPPAFMSLLPPLTIFFTDARGIRWRRDPGGQLARIAPGL